MELPSHVQTRTFVEPGTSEQCVAIVRVAPGQVLLALSRRSDGDLELAMPPDEATLLAAALERAAGQAVQGQ